MTEKELAAACELYDLLVDYYDDSSLQPPIEKGDSRHNAICAYRAALPSRHLPPDEGELMLRLLRGSRAEDMLRFVLQSPFAFGSRAEDIEKRRESQLVAKDWAGLLEKKYPSLRDDEPQADELGVAPVIVAGKGAAARNDWFMQQYNALGTDTYHKPVKIWRNWHDMTQEERAAICPDSPSIIAKETVVSCIKRTKTSLKRGGKKPAKANRAPRKKC